ncbi:D-alanine--D-alanine ligase family protein [Alkalibacillus almallahensis]|uniref:D-alanine--D-alanine ligase family protein n=1 Tax=Alkalibacillus almallahensis TaxID=1379154 RepID=UPI001424A06C|nr:D-alanine--D-alanine ligase [Alkalibacillus almallahensis]NIK12325.1 D-alanine-D-alanine ligase [Alkalibacillus almallahensis]
MKVAVLYGGTSKEREVSLSTGKGMIQALDQLDHDVVAIDFDPNQMEQLWKQLQEVDLVLIGLHGKQGEDGTVQGMLELMGVPYVGSGVLASSLAMDKSKAKQVFAMHDIPVARSQSFHYKEARENMVDTIKTTFTKPFVIKPNQEGSTLGLTIVESDEQIADAVQMAFTHDSDIIVEDYVSGRELTVSVLGNKGDEQALPIIEIVPKSKYYDYESKYAEGGSEHIVPAEISEKLTETIQNYANQAHRALGCETYSRVDFILSEVHGPVILEVNTLPGMTPTSLYPDAAGAVGISYTEMVQLFIDLSLEKYS